MTRPFRFVTNTLSVRISLMIVLAFGILLTAALFIMFRYSRKALKEEAVLKAETTLEATLQQIDNILLSVEQSAGNIYWDLSTHLYQPERMFVYSRELVEGNPYITGAAIAMEPGFYQDHDPYFMAYVHRIHSDSLVTDRSTIIQAETFGNIPYNQQIWYTIPMKSGMPCWINPLKEHETEGEAIITFSLPIYAKGGRKAGVLGIDISLKDLSDVVLAAKPSPNSYATLLGSDGSYIIHPDTTKLMHKPGCRHLKEYVSPSMAEAVKAMMAGETGYRYFSGKDNEGYVFYKPFVRSEVPNRAHQDLGWSVGIVYPEQDIFSDNNQLQNTVFIIAIDGLLLLFILCQTITHRQLQPLRILTKSAQRIADGHYDETVPDGHQQDEVGRLQYHFQQMQQSLANKVSELKQLTASLKDRSEELTQAYEQAKEADRVKTLFLHSMTDQMIEPSTIIITDATRLHEEGKELEQEEANQLVDEILKQGKKTTELLNDLLDASQKLDSSKEENS